MLIIAKHFGNLKLYIVKHFFGCMHVILQNAKSFGSCWNVLDQVNWVSTQSIIWQGCVSPLVCISPDAILLTNIMIIMI